MDEKAIKILLEKYKQGTANEEEKALLESWYLKFEEQVTEELSADERVTAVNLVWAKLEYDYHNVKRISIWPRVAAASILIFLLLGTYFVLHRNSVRQMAQNKIEDIGPGSNKAILSSNGKIYLLNNLKNGLLVKQGNVSVHKKEGGQLIYDADKSSDRKMTVVYDTLTIPRGGQFQLKLSDGSKVWLNAATQIRYPEKFNVKDRTVEIVYGEAYFEVKHNVITPFKVVVKGQTIQDIGTHFNINAYNDETVIKTTLIEGSISLTNSKQKTVLVPGDQAVINHNQQIEIVKDANIEKSIAWKNGFFNFDDADVGEVMRQISRWYDVDITYEGKIPNREFAGKIYRSTNALKVLDMLSYTRIHFRVENSKSGKRIIVTP